MDKHLIKHLWAVAQCEDNQSARVSAIKALAKAEINVTDYLAEEAALHEAQKPENEKLDYKYLESLAGLGG